jgi:tRNA/rRNA methyltransferase
MASKISNKVFHSGWASLRERISIVLIHPELSQNVGSAARAIANMGINGHFLIVGDPGIVNGSARKTAKHAGERLDQIKYFGSLSEVRNFLGDRCLLLASTARIGSPNRPHPLQVRDAMGKALGKLKSDEISSIGFVFGPEGDGLNNQDIDLCDWIVTIPSSSEYRSLNLAQAVLIFCHEANAELLEAWEPFEAPKPGQKQRLIRHLLQLAEEVGFILPGDPFKMRPRLESIFEHLPNHIRDIKTLHGLIAQTVRTVKAGHVELKGRFKRYRYDLSSGQET